MATPLFELAMVAWKAGLGACAFTAKIVIAEDAITNATRNTRMIFLFGFIDVYLGFY